MGSLYRFVVTVCLLQFTSGYRTAFGTNLHQHNRIQPLLVIPIEIADKLDPTRSWDVNFIFNGEEKMVSMCEDTSVLEMGQEIFDGVESSCLNGVCITCAGKVG